MGWRWGWRMGGRMGGPWPGKGPFSYLPPWLRPGWIFGRRMCWWLFHPMMYHWYGYPYYSPPYPMIYLPYYPWW